MNRFKGIGVLDDYSFGEVSSYAMTHVGDFFVLDVTNRRGYSTE